LQAGPERGGRRRKREKEEEKEEEEGWMIGAAACNEANLEICLD